MPKFAYEFYVTVKVKADSEKHAVKIAKEQRALALAAVKTNPDSTAKASPVMTVNL